MSRIRLLPLLSLALTSLLDLCVAILTFPEKVFHIVGDLLDFLILAPQLLTDAGMIVRTSYEDRYLTQGVHRFAQPSNRLGNDEDDDNANVIDNGLRRVGSGPRLRC